MNATDEERFHAKVDRSGGPDDCWPWTGRANYMGYGLATVDGKVRIASRRALVLHLGRELLPGHRACHTCDNPPCCNPAHLYEGTDADNRRDAVRRMRRESPWMAPPR